MKKIFVLLMLLLVVLTGCKPKVNVWEAIEKNDVKSLEYYLKKDPQVNSVDGEGNSLLMKAVKANSLDVVKVLLSKGANKELKNSKGESILEIIIKKDLVEMAKTIYDLENVSVENSYIYFISATRNDALEITRFLLNKGLDPNMKIEINNTEAEGGKEEMSPYQEGLKKDSSRVIDLFLSKNILVKDETIDTMLNQAVYYSSPKVVKLLLTKGANASGDKKDPNLNVATVNNDVEMIKMLIEKGVDINSKGESGMTPLDISLNANLFGINIGKSFSKGVTDDKNTDTLAITKFLLNNGANWKINNSKGDPILLDLLGEDNSEILEILFDKGLTIDYKFKNGHNLLSQVASNGLNSLIEPLLKNGIDVNIKNSNDINATPIIYAALNGRDETIELLIKKGADINAKLTNGATALHIAAQKDYISTVKLLIEKGANPKLEDKYGYTAYDDAVHYKVSQEVIDYLKSISN